MSRIVNPGAGDIADRLSILALKILFGTAAGKDVSHWEKERSQLLPKTAKSFSAEHWLDLAAVNAALIHADEDLRAIRIKANNNPVSDYRPLVEAGQLAFRIQELRDRRTELIELINASVGDDRGSENHN